MKPIWAGVALMALTLSACGEKGREPHFQVTGNAVIEKDAEVFHISFALGERNRDRAESLAAASGKIEEIRDKLRRLEGLEQLRFETSEAKVESVRPQGCDPDRTYTRTPYPESCEPVDHITSFVASIEGAPAEAAGSALSLLAELGVETVSAAHFDVLDRRAAELEARQAALQDATETAQALAEQAGTQVGAPVEISYGAPGARRSRLMKSPQREAGVVDYEVAPKIAPAQPLEFPAAKVEFSATVTVVFALEEPKARSSHAGGRRTGNQFREGSAS